MKNYTEYNTNSNRTSSKQSWFYLEQFTIQILIGAKIFILQFFIGTWVKIVKRIKM